ncbi:MAG: amino acid ABC transporter substrate-binding protein [Clostridia bacterium]|nr:amino acid ABC transporter substrate-binding protein [Clostridia bacterium]
MKKLISILIIIAICITAFAACGKNTSESAAYDKYLAAIVKGNKKTNGTLTVATSPDFAPMEFCDLSKTGQAQYVGFDILLANYIAAELDMELVIKPMSFDSVMAAVKTGSADLGIAGFSWTAARAETFLITDYYKADENESSQIVITTVANKDKFKTADDFNGVKVGAQGGSLQELLVTEQLVPKGAELVKMDNINDLYTALLAGNIDALAVADGNANALLADDADKACKPGFEFEVEEKYKNNVILVNKNNQELCDKVNTVLAKAMSEGVYTGWYEASKIYANINTKDELGYDDEGNKITE